MATLVQTLARFFGYQPARPLSTASMGEVTGQVSQAFPARLSMAALVRHPYVYASVTRIATDLARLPLYAVALDSNGRQVGVVDLPPDLRKRPNSAQTLREFRAQIVADWLLSGNGYALKAPFGGYYRLHPASMVVEHNALGLPTGYRFAGSTRYTLEEIAHIRGLSWQDSAQMLLGESPIRALYDELDAAASAKQQAAIAAKRGRPDWLLSPKDADGSFGGGPGRDPGAKIRDEWEKQLVSGKGAIFIGDALEATQLSTSLRDMEYQVLQERADSAILAVFGVPPSVIGIPAANYGTSKQDARAYWDRRKADAAHIDEFLTELYGVPGRLEIRHDFHEVEPLQVAKTEQIEQAARLVELGAMPYAALEWCGLRAPPMSADTEPRAAQMRPATAEEVDEPQGVRSLAGLLAVSRAGYERAVSRGLPLDRRAADLEAMAGDLGIERAATVAEAVHRYVADHLAECQRAGTEPYIRGLGCWTPAFTERLQRHLEAA